MECWVEGQFSCSFSSVQFEMVFVSLEKPIICTLHNLASFPDVVLETVPGFPFTVVLSGLTIFTSSVQ